MQKTDEIIKKDVVDQLFWDDRVDASNIKVDVSKGAVTLSGNVPNHNALRSALEDTFALREVRSIVNNLIVEYPGSQSLPTDYNLRTNIEGILLLNSSIDSSEIDVNVQDRVATLEGSVDSYWKKLKAEELTFDVTGIMGVNNLLSVVPSQDVLDKTIAEDIIKAFNRNVFIDVNDVDVQVEDGMVTLFGTVQDWSAQQAALNIAKYTSGVRDVKNDLTIASE